jgi:hypothetical protein
VGIVLEAASAVGLLTESEVRAAAA